MTESPIGEKQLMVLWTAHAARIFAYILTLEPQRANAEDIFQETAMVVWEKRTEFTPGTDFRAWACRIAYFNVLSFARHRRKFGTVDEQLLEMLSHEIPVAAEEIEPRLSALGGCLEKLSPRNRKILELRYASGATAKQLAEVTKLSVVGVYKALQRIQDSLLACIEREIAREDRL
jgi:RNA polymerase sigma-70 factor (ECF subfamily)